MKQKALVIGLGVSGRSAAAFLLKQGVKVHGIDKKAEALKLHDEVVELMQKGLEVDLESTLINMSQFDFVIVSPGVPQTNPVYIQAKERNIPIYGEIELACRFMQGTFLGITGTNGKTTVTLMITHVLNHNGRKAQAVGNIGTALSSSTENQSEIHVIELSSFQLETLHTKFLDAAVILNITPDHLDRYRDMNDYASAKIHIGECLKKDGILFVENECAMHYESMFSNQAMKTYGFSEDCFFHTDLNDLFVNNSKECPLPLLYRNKKNHDLENVMAAYALCRQVGITSTEFMNALESFKKPSHRIEFVKTINDVSYYDDSKGTNIDAVMRAVESLNGPIILIAGGVDKGASYVPWVKAFQNKVKAICTIGEAAPKMMHELSKDFAVHNFASLEAAVAYASQIACKGTSVLLSPGCASFDMFQDYAHRGREFQRIVNKL